MKKRSFLGAVSILLCTILPILPQATALAAGIDNPETTEAQVYTTNKIGTFGDFDFELWRDQGEALMTVNHDGTFLCEWDRNKTSNVLFRTGKKLGSNKTHDEFGTMSLEYGCDYQPSGNSYLCVYGWSVDPLVEFYVLENFTTYNPGTDGTTYLGSVTIDDCEYKLYEGLRVEKPSIKGTATFKQYWSINTTKRTEGTVSISEHFKAWEEAGLELGNLYEVAFCVEGYKSSGTAHVYSNQLTIGDTVIGVVNESITKDDDTLDPDDDEDEIDSETPSPQPEETPAQTPAESIAPTPAPTENTGNSDPDSDNGIHPAVLIVLGILGVGGVLLYLVRRGKS